MKTGAQTSETSNATQDDLAEKNGLAIVVVDENSFALSVSNNNSMCRFLYNSDEFAPECAKFCGKAFEWATEAGETVGYKCYAGLNCLAVPMKKEEKQTVAIVGRAFVKAEDYRAATERAITGDWKKFSPTEFFENVLLGNSEENLKKLAKRIGGEGEKGRKGERETRSGGVEEKSNKGNGNIENDEILELPALTGRFAEIESREPKIESLTELQILDEPQIFDDESPSETQPEILDSRNEIESENNERHFDDERNASRGDDEQPTADNELPTTDNEQQTMDEINPQPAVARSPQTNWRSLFGSMLDLNYRQAYLSIVRFIKEHYSLADLVWLERRGNRLEAAFADGKLKDREIQLSIAADDERLKDAASREAPLELRERQATGATKPPITIRLFPFSVGGEIRSALIVGDPLEEENKQRRIAKFCKMLASDLEILRLREELAKRNSVERAVGRFNKSTLEIDSEDFWAHLMNVSAELMRAERTSLLVFDEKSDSFKTKAATGIKADFLKRETENLGERVAKSVLSEGEPVVVADINKIGLQAAPEDWLYKSDSFISYPISIGTRKIGVLNVTDKADGDAYNADDLELLGAIMPSLAVMIDRADLKNKAGEFEQLSVTDALTGLLNRRYLEERLTEEIKRSGRHGFPTSFMMIDVDEFKSYNDSFGHTEGDKALKIVGSALKETLRGVDVAARYGGEEFSILLPQTNPFEAATIAERVRERVASTAFPNRRVTVSIGIASCSEVVKSVRDLVAAADKALYEAKRRGRNNVQIYENLNAPEIVEA